MAISTNDPTPDAQTPSEETSDAHEKVLDVRPIPPRQKHPSIFATFDALDVEDHFVLVNDHDPVPLKHQFAFEREGLMQWEYLEEGPDVWRVQITRVPEGEGEVPA